MDARLNGIVLGGLLAAVLGAGLWFMPQAAPSVTDLSKPIATLDAKPVPSVYFTDIHDDVYNFDDFKGKLVVVNFWASWCAPCVTEMPQLLKLAAKHGVPMRLILVSVDTGEDKVRGFFKKHNWMPTDNVLIVWDKDKAISKDVFGTIRYPESLIIDKKGNMVQKVVGATDWTGADMQANINDLLK